MIVALGESVVVIGAGASGLPLDGGLVLVALLSLSLSAALWWCTSATRPVEDAFQATPPERRPQLALNAFGYWLRPSSRRRGGGGRSEEGDRRPVRAPRGWIGVELAAGAALFVACDVGFRRTRRPNATRPLAAGAILATIPLGTEVGAAACRRRGGNPRARPRRRGGHAIAWRARVLSADLSARNSSSEARIPAVIQSVRRAVLVAGAAAAARRCGLRG